MKHVITLIILLWSLATQVNATTITAQVNNAKWSVSSSWNPNRQPVSGDTIIIPAALNLKVDGNENLNNIVVIIRGTLTFTNGKLRLDALSKVIVDFGGTIAGGGNNDQISIDGVFKYRGTDPPVLGYAIADVTTGNGFRMFGVLPFRFVSFTALAVDKGIQLSWTYNFSSESRYFEVQSSVDGKRWATNSRIVAQDLGSVLQHYNITLNDVAQGVSYYRIVQIDYNGTALYSEVRTAGNKNANGTLALNGENPKAYVTGNRVTIDYTGTTSRPVMIRLLNTNGQVMRQQQYDGSQLQLSITVSNDIHGIHIVQVIEANNKSKSFRLML